MSRVVLCAAVLAALTTAPWSFAQGNRRRAERSEPSVQLPINPRLWYNSSPLSMESLKGKGVVFYFFEETCPVCSEGWRDVQRLVEQHQDQPILFVAVNSGTSSREVQQYLRRNRVSIPVIHDPTRQFENALGVPQLALGGVTYQLRYVAGDGSSGQAQGLGPAAFANAIRSASKGAEWRVDPAGLPRSLMGPWRSIELGDFDAAARAVNKAADSSNEDVKAGAEKLLEAIKEEASDAARTAKDSLESGDKWQAYKGFESVANRFGGYDLPPVEFSKGKVKELARDKAVKDEVAAAKLLGQAVAKGSVSKLKRVGSRYPATEAATRAAEMLASMDR